MKIGIYIYSRSRSILKQRKVTLLLVKVFGSEGLFCIREKTNLVELPMLRNWGHSNTVLRNNSIEMESGLAVC